MTMPIKPVCYQCGSSYVQKRHLQVVQISCWHCGGTMKAAFVMVGESEISPGVQPEISDESGYIKTPDHFHPPEFKHAAQQGAIIRRHFSKTTEELGFSNFCPNCNKPTGAFYLPMRIIGKIRQCNIVCSYNCAICDENELPDEDAISD